MTRAPGNPGFTLIELVVALVVVAMIGGVSVLVLNTTIGARQRVDRQAAVQQEARAAVTAIATALANANRPVHTDDIVLEGTPDRTGAAPADRIRFATVSDQVIRRGQPESDIHEVEFVLREVGPTHAKALMRRTNPVRDEPPRPGGVLDRLADNVVALEFNYFDGTHWREDWPETLHEWPVAVRLSVALDDPAAPAAVVQATRLMSFPRRPQPPVGPQDTQAVRDAHQDQQREQSGGAGASGGDQGGEQ